VKGMQINKINGKFMITLKEVTVFIDKKSIYIDIWPNKISKIYVEKTTKITGHIKIDIADMFEISDFLKYNDLILSYRDNDIYIRKDELIIEKDYVNYVTISKKEFRKLVNYLKKFI